ncbi:NBR1-Ig-like domain-containing protein [Dactylosporangium sp. NPDC051484]|uniref:NBR1-Ig-like domain-containing protein n=1 Tax=Dactylosporangium sp. NPDC051484 TaxID=3154942 RepID=UPI00344E97BF
MTAKEFAGQLRTLRTAAGNPSFRQMAARSGRISHTTLHEAAAGTRFPSWETTREFVRACEADEVQWRRRWEDAQRPATVHAVPDGGLTAATADSPADSPAEAHDPAPGDTLPTDVVAAADEIPRARRHRLPWLAVAAGVAALVAVLGIIVHGRSSAHGSRAVAASPSSTPFSDSLIRGDSSKFIADVTIPDGTRVKVNTHFVKVWALANVGTVDWHDRFLARMNPTSDDNGCQVPDRVAIGDTPPGQQVMISVPVTAPSRPAECWVSWKMVDESGNAYFPSRRPVYFMVTVVA